MIGKNYKGLRLFLMMLAIFLSHGELASAQDQLNAQKIAVRQADLQAIQSLVSESPKIVEVVPKSGLNVVHVFKISCPCSKKELPALEQLAKTQKIIGLIWVASPLQALEWLKENGNNYSEVGVLSDQGAAALGVTSTPATLAIDKDGTVVASLQGAITVESFNSSIGKALK